ncbi:HAD hydrolase-like protein [Noviherbaspirillum aerium]|uniref:HAD hydrolase-like protein n=1 Tax=Noviherbaspirillum aerium TaxID=2588497 RepID=UPI00124C6959|nr:HAD hydrolase-like protein [Noviherbaspirillum aerium]
MAAESDRPRLVVFDFDGTLADSFPFFLRTFDVLAGRHDFRPIAGDDLNALRGYDARQIMRHVGIPLWKVPRVASDFRSMMADVIEDIALFDGIGAMLQALAGENIRLAVLSSNSEANVRAVLGPEHARLIDRYACGASLFGKRGKLRRLLEAMNVERRHALCIGDEVRDAEAARDEGLRFGAVAWGYTRSDVLAAAGPDYLFERVDDIAPALLGEPVRPRQAAADRPC